MDTDDLARQLGRLLRGRGLLAPNVVSQVTPELRQACGVGADDAPGEIRVKVADCIRSHATALPDDLRLAVLAALGLCDAAAYPLLKDRLEWIGGQLDREPRTAQRRVDAGLRLIAERLVASSMADEDDPFAPGGWYTDELLATFRLDLDPPELSEERSIVATRDGLQEVLASLTAPGKAQDAEALDIRFRMGCGGRIIREGQPVRGHHQARIELLAPLAIGEHHRFTITFIMRPRDAIRPYYLMTPLRPCRRFSMSVVFDLATPPVAVWRVDGVPRGVLDETDEPGKRMTIDGHGRVSADFHILRQGLSYGIQWSAQSLP